MASNMLSINDVLIDNIPGARPPDKTLNAEHTDPQQPDVSGTIDLTKTKANRQVVGVDNVEGKVYGEGTGLYNMHRKYSAQ
jgi:hypothetical protein